AARSSTICGPAEARDAGRIASAPQRFLLRCQGSRFLAPLIGETHRGIACDGLAVAEPGSIERKTGKLALARTTFLQIFEADGIAEAHEVRAHIARKQHPSPMQQKRDLSRAMPGSMNDFDA